jgi:hypothetical protein
MLPFDAMQTSRKIEDEHQQVNWLQRQTTTLPQNEDTCTTSHPVVER